MSQLPYDITSPSSILNYAKGLSGKTLAEVVDLSGVIENLSHKGDLGNMVEKYYFQYLPNSTHGPDFAEAGVELKTTGVKKSSKNIYEAKERLVLSMINYVTLVDEDWSTNSLMQKCRLMLLLFYYYQKDVAVYNRRFVFNPLLWEFPEVDLKVIEADWKLIQSKIKDGRAHELSEGDTFYLGACRKGAGGAKESLRKQPFSDLGAKARAFSLKPSYVNTILSGYAQEAEIISTISEAKTGIEEITLAKFKPFIGMTVESIADILKFDMSGKVDKSVHQRLALKILGSKKKNPPEFEKAGIKMKTIRLETNNKPKESMSFPAFKYMDIVNEEWDESNFSEALERKFLFIVFQYDNNDILRFKKAMFWNMPYEDREEARKVWEFTKKQIIDGNADKLPGMKDSYVAHVRPHGRNADDTIPTPDGKLLVRKCFWLNNNYIAKQLK